MGSTRSTTGKAAAEKERHLEVSPPGAIRSTMISSSSNPVIAIGQLPHSHRMISKQGGGWPWFGGAWMMIDLNQTREFAVDLLQIQQYDNLWL